MKQVAICVALTASLSAGMTHAAAYALMGQGAAGLGNAHAGQAALAADAGTGFSNPAGLPYVEGRRIAFAGHLVAPSLKFSADPDSTAAALGDGGNAGVVMAVPAAWLALDLTRDVKFGLGVSAPLGMTSEYDAPWAGQHLALRSRLRTVNLNPALGWRVNRHLAVGLGASWQRADMTLTRKADGAGSPTRIASTDSDWGWNAGAIWDFDGHTRLGLAYRSELSHRLEGWPDPLQPESLSLSLFQRINPYWDFLADVTWTGWGRGDPTDMAGASMPVIADGWENTRRYALGLTHHMSRAWSWRVGLAYEESPVPDPARRSPRLPDADRIWLAFGGQYRLGPAQAVDFGYAHLFMRDAEIDRVDQGVRLSGDYRGHVDIVSVQYTRAF